MAGGSTASIPVRTTAHPFALILGLVVMAVALGLRLLFTQPPPPKPETAPANEFSAARAVALEVRLLGDGTPHPIGTEANARVRARIVDELTALGYPVETQAAFACRAESATCGNVTNVLTRLPGREDGPAVLLTAHYDSVWASPGAADDMAGVATILEIARILRAEAPGRNPVIFLLSDGEEPILLGAEAFVAEHPWADDVGVVVNLEANGTSGPSILFETTENNAWLISAFAARAPRPVTSSMYDVMFEFLPFNTDLDVYKEAGLPGINFAFAEDFAHYHTPLDNLANLDPGSVQHHGDNALAAVRAFAEEDLTDPPTGSSVYLDVWPGVVLQWPEPWTIWLALACVLVWLGFAAGLIRRDALPLRALLWGLPVLPLGLLGAALLGLALALGISRLTGAPAPWYANPLPMRVAVWTGAFFSLTVVATAVARRAGFWGLSLGVWLGWSFFSLLVAWSAPGAGVIFLLPTILATLALVGVGATPLRASPRAWVMAAAVALFGASAIWLPVALSNEREMGFDPSPIVGVAVGLAASALTPLLALPAEYAWARRRLPAGAALLVMAAAGVALRTPVYSEFSPQRLNLLHVTDRYTGQAHWLIERRAPSASGAADAPESLRRAGRFGSEPATALPWSRRQYLLAPATPTAAPAPAVQLLADTHLGGERVVQLRLRSARGGNEVSLYVPEAAGLHQIDVLGTPHIIEEIPGRDGYQAFHCHGPGCDGLALALHLESDGPFPVFIVDKSSGLPPGGSTLVQARPTTAVPSGDGDVTLMADRLLIGAGSHICSFQVCTKWFSRQMATAIRVAPPCHSERSEAE